jgi:hypothetical protein
MGVVTIFDTSRVLLTQIGYVILAQPLTTKSRSFYMTKEVVKHRKDEKKKPTLTPKEKKAKKQEKKQGKNS